MEKYKSVIESNNGKLIKFNVDSLPLRICEFFFITEVPVGVVRGRHAHKECIQLISVIAGEIELLIEEPSGIRFTILMDSNKDAFLLPANYWAEQKYTKPNTVLFVACSKEYDDADYIRDLNLYRSFNSR
jgi:dTDP-4-dehydrorhamnose 3,5-epimerase-like enzyme